MPTEPAAFQVDPESPAGRALGRSRDVAAEAGPRRVAVLGATGTIGDNALAIVRRHPARFTVETLAAGTRMRALAALVAEFRPAHVVVASDAARAELAALCDLPKDAIAVGRAGLAEAAARPVDVVLHGVSGAAGLPATLAAVDAGNTLALANKESLVLAGELVDARARVSGACIVPVDSEHAGLFQCLLGLTHPAAFRRLILTASGGPLRGRDDWADATPAEVLAHPVWAMGPRITVDSALLVNKGLEVIEARALFGVPLAAIDVVVHPQAIVHALVEGVDHSTLAQLSVPDMKLPIQYALAWPRRLDAPLPPLDWARAGRLEFAALTPGRHPAFDLVLRAAATGGTQPATLNAADEVLVNAFLAGRIRLGDVPALLAECLAAAEVRPADTLAAIDRADAAARELATALLARHGAAPLAKPGALPAAGHGRS